MQSFISCLCLIWKQQSTMSWQRSVVWDSGLEGRHERQPHMDSDENIWKWNKSILCGQTIMCFTFKYREANGSSHLPWEGIPKNKSKSKKQSKAKQTKPNGTLILHFSNYYLNTSQVINCICIHTHLVCKADSCWLWYEFH